MPELAIGGVELVALVVAAAALLVLIALWVLLKPLQLILSHVAIPGIVPFVGGANLGDLIAHRLEDAIRAVAGSMDWLVRASAHLLWAAGVGVWHWVYQVTQGILSAHGAIVALRAATFGLFLKAVAEAESLYGSAVAELHQAEHNLQANINTVHDVLLSNIDKGLAIVTGYVQTAYDQAIAHLSAGLAVVTGYVQGVYDELVNRISAAETDVRAEAVRLFGQAEADIAATAAGAEAAVAGLEGRLQGEIGQVIGDLAKVMPLLGILPLVGAIPGLITEVTTCVDPLCDTVTPNAKQLGQAGSLLKAVDGIVDAGLLAALVTAAVEDPAGTAGVVVDTTGWLSQLGVDLARAAGAAV